MIPTAPAALAAALVDRYAIERELGAGGMATVYLAHDLRHGRQVALKVLRPELSSALGAERFLAEIRTTAALQHPHILPLFDSGQAGDLLFYVMPYVEGESLRDRLSREGQLPIADALRIAADVASALDYAHRHDVIHRDIKPENILLHEGDAIVADFGIALAVSHVGRGRLTATGHSLGTPMYMSPEQATGDRLLDARSDVYSLGAVLYEMLAGEAPYTGPSAQAIIAKLLTERPTRLHTVRQTVPAHVDAAVQMALALSPADRFASAAQFAQALTTPARPVRLLGRATRTRWTAIGLVALALLGGAWWTARGSRRIEPLPELERVQQTFTGNASDPALSPDGRRVAYSTRECGDWETCDGNIVIADMPATTVQVIVRVVKRLGRIQWTADGRFLLYEEWRGSRPGGYIVSTLGGAPRFVGPGSVTQLGNADTLIVAEGLLTPSGWLRVVTMSDGVVADSIRVPLLYEGGEGWDVLGAPSGDLLAVAQYDAESTWTVLVVDREGVIHDSLSGRYQESFSMDWAPSGDALIMTDKRRDNSGWNVLRLPLGRSAGRDHRIDTVARQLAMAPGSFSVGRTGIAAYGESRTEWTRLAFSRPAGTNADVNGIVTGSSTGRFLWALLDPVRRRMALLLPVGSAESPLGQLALTSLDGGDTVTVGPPRLVLDLEWKADGSRLLILEGNPKRPTLMEIDPVSGAGTAIGAAFAMPIAEFASLSGGGVVAMSCVGTHCWLHLRSVPGRADTSIAAPDQSWWLLPRPDGSSVSLLSAATDSAGRSFFWVILEVDLLSGRSRELGRFPNTAELRLARWTDNTHIEYFLPLAKGTGWLRLEMTTGKTMQVATMSHPIGVSYQLSSDGHHGLALLRRQRRDVVLLPNFAERLK